MVSGALEQKSFCQPVMPVAVLKSAHFRKT
jgi:hypothetical protein